MKKVLTILLLLAFHGKVVAQKIIPIKVIDDKSLLALPFVSVFNKKTEMVTRSNENGYFQMEGHPSDSIQLSSLGYQKKTLLLEELMKTENVKLISNTEYLEAVNVIAGQSDNVGVQGLDKLSLKLLPLNNAQDLLKTVSGLFIAQHAGGGKAEQIFLRGFDNDHGTDFGVFIDGIPVNLSSHAHGQGYADMHFIIPELIQNADYYKGPYEMKNGNFSVSGAARYKTKNALDKSMVKFDIGEYGYQRGLVLLNLTPDNKLFSIGKSEQAYLALEGTLNKSFFESPQIFRKFSSFFIYNSQLSKATSVVFSTSYFTSDWNASGQIPLRAYESEAIGWFGAIDDREGGATARFNSTLKFNTFLKNNQRISNQVYYANNAYQLVSNFTFFLNDSSNGDRIEQGESRDVLGYTFEYNRKDKIKKTKLRSTYSMGFRSDLIHSKLASVIQTNSTETLDHNRITETNYWAYIKENWKLNSKWLLQFGSRIDYFNFIIKDQLGTNVSGERNAYRLSPKVSLFYNPTENIQLFVKGGSGYHSNYTQAAVSQKDIHPLAKANGADLGTEFKIGKVFVGTVSLWTIQSGSEYIFVADAGAYENNGRALRKGIDFAGKLRPIKNTWLNFSVNYSKGTLLDEPTTANSIPSAPVFTGTASVLYKHPKGLDLYLGVRYMAERPLTEDESVFADRYFLMDGSINYTLQKFQFGVSVQNILNVRWMEAVFYDASQLKNESEPVDDFHFTPGTPRYIKGSLSYSF
jgi:outer membrane receptor for ferrienterochelin and colicin